MQPIQQPIAYAIRHDMPLRALNTFGIAASAHAYVQVDGAATLRQALTDPALAGLPRLLLGGGSNILLTGDFPGVVLHMVGRGIAVIARDAETIDICCAAGESWHGLVEWTLAQGFGGLENLSLIPGTVGAAPIQNIGAYGVEVASLIRWVRCVHMETGDEFVLDRAACEFGYRDSIFKQRLRGLAAIVEVCFALPARWQPNLEYAELRHAIMGSDARLPGADDIGAATTSAATSAAPLDPATISAAVIAIRTRKLPDPRQIGNAGSFFKNPLVSAAERARLLAAWPNLVSHAQPDGSYKLAAGWLIEQSGWKGRSLGKAGVYEKQALVLVNRGEASGADIARLAAAIQADVQARFGVALEPEPIVI